MNNKYRYLVPNGITFASLTCGILSILLAATGEPKNLTAAGILILASYILDLFDGYTARRLQASSEFGLQLDSLVDMVSLGTAPAVLTFMHLQSEGLTGWWVWPFVIIVPLAGAFRLARFNLLPPKQTGNTDSMGLTISTGGATLALSVLTDLTIRGDYLPEWTFVLLMLVVSLLMVSTIAFPSFFWVFSGKRKRIVLISLLGASVFVTPFFHAWFIWNNAYLGLSLARAGYYKVR
ncbi:MAG: CDP-alcohol phosphatidyltransferase family protein [Anaerolineales bacterium]|nr:CDP-alcohol phosphatidyltransferase family protein [Anaerolineales bacterium]MCB8991952.1 CDP-alcohol phosphatidyltransferase family protein [Ardenticatenaceae bacterium]MCB9004762.1 CDP-alcohol phosphatidyltransferase family protein [Ardenticatenaceae bacterium]